MPSTIRWRHVPSVFPVRLSIVALVAAFACVLGFASPSSAQVTSTPANEIFKAPGTATFTINVPSGTTLAKVSVLTLGAPNLDFTEVAGGTTCPNVTSGTCAVEVQFQPTAADRRQGSVVLSDPTGKLLLNVSLDGSGSAPVAGFAPSIISTFAGGGTGGAGGPATSAQLGTPMGIAVDGFGNHYIADSKDNRVWKVSPSGTITAFAGNGTAGYSGDGGPATSAELNDPSDVIVDGAGYVYISDTKNNVVRMVDTAGIITTYAGQYYAPGTTPPPVCATATNSVGDGCPGNQIVLNTPMGLVFCHAQNLHIADELNDRVRTIDHVKYTTTTQVGDGTQGYNGDGEGNMSAELNHPTGLDMDAANYIYVADTGNHIIRKTLLTGSTPNPISTVAGTPGAANSLGDGGPAISAELNSPSGVKVDAAGDIYISDSASNVVREVNSATGVITTIAGNGAAGYTGDGSAASGAQLNTPAGVLVDQDGTLYVADSQNGVVRKINLPGAPSLTFSSTPVGASSAAQDVAVMNIGSAPLTISQITTPANYSLGGADTSCTATGGGTLNDATSCILGVEFTPKSAGAVDGNIVLTDNATPATQTITVNGTTSAAASSSASYTVTAKTPAVTISSGSTGTAMLNLTSTNYAGTVSFTTSVAPQDGAPADVTASASSVALASGGTGTSTLTITVGASSAANRKPARPWKGGGIALFAFLLGVPLIFRRKRTAGLLLLALAFSLGGFLAACSGGPSSSRMPSTSSTRTYTVTATPSASPAGSTTVANAPPVTITVTVQ